MKAMILAAGRGKRMMPLTAHTPKPLLKVAGTTIIEHNIKQLKAAGVKNIIINIAYLGEKIRAKLGNGSIYGLNITYSPEAENALETAGGIINALPLLGKKPFLVLNGDTLNDYPLQKLELPATSLSHLVLVPNPKHNPDGDFSLGKFFLGNTPNIYHLTRQHKNPYTFSGIAIYHPNFFKNKPNKPQALYPLFTEAIAKQTITAEVYHGFWYDVGTPERFYELQKDPRYLPTSTAINQKKF